MIDDEIIHRDLLPHRLEAQLLLYGYENGLKFRLG